MISLFYQSLHVGNDNFGHRHLTADHMYLVQHRIVSVPTRPGNRIEYVKAFLEVNDARIVYFPENVDLLAGQLDRRDIDVILIIQNEVLFGIRLEISPCRDSGRVSARLCVLPGPD